MLVVYEHAMDCKGKRGAIVHQHKCVLVNVYTEVDVEVNALAI